MRLIHAKLIPLVVLPALIAGAFGCTSRPRLTAEERRGDIQYLAQWSRDYSPFPELNQKLRGTPDVQALAPEYMRRAAEAASDAEFLRVVHEYFDFIGVSGHGHLLSESSLRGFLYESRRHPGQLPPEQLKAGLYWAKLRARQRPESPPTPFCNYNAAEGNCVCLELAEDVGYIRVKCMGGRFIEKDGRKIRRFLAASDGRYRKLIIDVRHNGGGVHYYAFDNLVVPFLDRSASYSEIAGIKRRFIADRDKAFLDQLRGGVSIFAHERKITETDPPEGWDKSAWIFYRIDRRVDPADRYNFAGRLFILMDGHTGSAADEYVNAAQRMGLATLVGQCTPGSCAPYFNPVLVRLPASGMIFVLEADLMLNRDGTVNEIAGTKPDLELPPQPLPDCATREALLRDQWVQRVIAEPTRPEQPAGAAAVRP